jgi:hypothetical protein
MPDKMIVTNWILYSALCIGCAAVQAPTLEAHIDRMLGLSTLLLMLLGFFQLLLKEPFHHVHII